VARVWLRGTETNPEPFALLISCAPRNLWKVSETGGDVSLCRFLGSDDAGAEVTVICELNVANQQKIKQTEQQVESNSQHRRRTVGSWAPALPSSFLWMLFRLNNESCGCKNAQTSNKSRNQIAGQLRPWRAQQPQELEEQGMRSWRQGLARVPVTSSPPSPCSSS
jgi:hypothetical protein